MEGGERKERKKKWGREGPGGPGCCMASVAMQPMHTHWEEQTRGVVLLRFGRARWTEKEKRAAGAYRRRAEVAGGASAGGGGSRAVQGHVQRPARRRLPPVAAPPEGSLPAAVPCQQQRRRAPADLDDVESRVRTSRRRGARWSEEGRQGTPELGAIIPATRR
jgi:hypothetical protein